MKLVGGFQDRWEFVMQFLGWNVSACRKTMRLDGRVWPGAEWRLEGAECGKSDTAPVREGLIKCCSAKNP